jgi:energy-coupling factor transport system ATP-binding protein
MTEPVAVSVEGWGWRHGGRRAWALRGVDLRVDPGERVLLLGPSGSGKSTLLAALAGLLDPEQAGATEGTVRLDGAPAREARGRAGLVLQDPESALVMARAGDDVAFGLENLAVPADEIWPRVDEALAAVGFPYGRDAATARLSGGEQQRLALAGALAMRPGLLLLDEVTSSLDPPGAALVRESLRRVLADTGATCVLVEHRVADVLDLVDRVVVLEAGGGVVADGTPASVFTRQGAELAARGVWVPGREPQIGRPAGSSAGGPALLTGRGLGFRYPAATVDAVGPCDVELRAGEVLAVTGANGSGKSTLALLLAGLLAPTRGAVEPSAALGGPPDRPLHRWRARDLVRAVGTVFQDPEHQFVASTVETELRVGPRAAGLVEAQVASRTRELLERLRLDHLAAANPYTLSGGEKRRLSVATALATRPAVIAADEPTYGQDARTWAELAELVLELRDEGCAIFVVTHDRPFVDAVADREQALTAPAEALPR